MANHTSDSNEVLNEKLKGSYNQFFTYRITKRNPNQFPELLWDGKPVSQIKVPKSSFSTIFNFNPSIIYSNNEQDNIKPVNSPKGSKNTQKIQKNTSVQTQLPFSSQSYNSTKTQRTQEKNFSNKLDCIDQKFPSNQSLYFLPKFKKWKNRLIQGDSLIGMSNLINEGYEDSIQMIYMDPPYGINYKATFISGSQNTEGYIDNWDKGLNSYLDYLRERLILMHKLLSSTGSIFVQIGDSNLHYVRCLLDEVFGTKNFVNLITFRTAISTNKIQNIADYLLWYAKDKSKVFQRKLFIKRPLEKKLNTFTYTYTDPKNDDKIPFKPQELVKRINKKKSSNDDRLKPIKFKNKEYLPPDGFEWRWDTSAIEQLIKLNRIYVINGKLYGMRFEKDFPAMLLTNIWNDSATSTFAAKKHYTVHTNPKVIRRCINMSSNPGDLILDPTLGSGTTAVVAEELGRRWIGFDTSPSSILSSINWLLGNKYPYFRWDANCQDFEYKKIPRISLSDLAKDRPLKTEPWYGKIKKNMKSMRFCSPFRLETLSSNTPLRFSNNIQEDQTYSFFTHCLLKNGIMFPSGESLHIQELNIIKTFHRSNITTEPVIGYLFNSITNQKEEIKITILSSQKPDDILAILKESCSYEKINSVTQLIFVWNLSAGIISEFSDKNYLKMKIFLGVIHPDLRIHHLIFDNHPEAFRVCGLIQIQNNLVKILTPDPLKNFDLLPISTKQIAFWTILNIDESENQWKTLGNIRTLQLPFYLKYMDKFFREFLGSTIDSSPIPTIEEVSMNNLLFYGQDYGGSPYFGKISRNSIKIKYHDPIK